MDAFTAIDLSLVPSPDALEELSYSDLLTAYKTRFTTFWTEAQAIDSTLPDYNVSELQTDPAMIVGQSYSYLRLLDRARVNDGIRALLGPLAQGTSLENIVATRGILRQELTPATSTSDAVMEDDVQLFRRFLVKQDLPSSGSSGRYLYDAFDAMTTLVDARTNGFDIHGRRGDTDVVVAGPDGRTVTDEELTSISAAVRHKNRMQEGISVSILNATRQEYINNLTLVLPSIGPDPSVIVEEVKERIRNVQATRMVIGGSIPDKLISGAAFGDGSNILEIIDNSPVIIEGDLYSIPVGGEPVVDYVVN